MSPRVRAVLVAAAWVLGVAVAAPSPLRAAGAAPAVCNQHEPETCNARTLRRASEAALRAAGPTLVMACERRGFSESPLSGGEMAQCIEVARYLAADLSAKWAGTLEPIDPGLIRYEWNHSTGECITFVTGYCVCPVEGYARLPLRWRAAPPAASPPSP